jgi:Domain of unknown function (DUF3366)./O-Antigen ligase.
MSLPLLWSPSTENVAYALPRIVGLWAGLFFWLTLRQCHFTERQKQWFLYALAFSGMTEGVIVLLELHGPSGWLPETWRLLLDKYGRGGAGAFQQVNVTASFIATSLASSLLLVGMRSAGLPGKITERLRLSALICGIVLQAAVLMSVYSRAGWIGGVLVVVGIFCMLTHRRFRPEGQHQALLLMLPLVGIMLGIGIMNLSVTQAMAVHDGSNQQRLLTLFHTFIFASHHPFAGYGAGTYEGAYQAYLALIPGGNPGVEMMTHPHNELLYQFAEGGGIALSGVLLWCGLYVRLWLKVKTLVQAGALTAMLPVLVHTQVEFPLYYSVPHWLMLLILLRLSENERIAMPSVIRHPFRYYACRIVMLSLMLYGVTISVQACRLSFVLDEFENSELVNPECITRLTVPGIFRLRYEHDLALLRLLRFQEKPDIDSLLAFTRENERALSVYARPELYSNQIAVLHYLHKDVQAAQWRDRAEKTLPWEKEFKNTHP